MDHVTIPWTLELCVVHMSSYRQNIGKLLAKSSSTDLPSTCLTCDSRDHSQASSHPKIGLRTLDNDYYPKRITVHETLLIVLVVLVIATLVGWIGWIITCVLFCKRCKRRYIKKQLINTYICSQYKICMYHTLREKLHSVIKLTLIQEVFESLHR